MLSRRPRHPAELSSGGDQPAEAVSPLEDFLSSIEDDSSRMRVTPDSPAAATTFRVGSQPIPIAGSPIYAIDVSAEGTLINFGTSDELPHWASNVVRVDALPSNVVFGEAIGASHIAGAVFSSMPSLTSPSLDAEVRDLRRRVSALEAEVRELRRDESEVIVLRTISREDAKAEIR